MNRRDPRRWPLVAPTVSRHPDPVPTVRIVLRSAMRAAGVGALLLVIAACGGDPEGTGATESTAAAAAAAPTAPSTSVQTERVDSTTTSSVPTTTAPSSTTSTSALEPATVDTDALFAALVAAEPSEGEPLSEQEARCFADASVGAVGIEPSVTLLVTVRDYQQAWVEIHRLEMTSDELIPMAEALRACFSETFTHAEFGEMPSYWWNLAEVLEAAA